MVHPQRLRLTQPSLTEQELRAVGEVLDSGNLTQGARASEFEDLVALQTGSAFALATSSCTTGLHLCLDAIGVGPGDEVIVPDFTFPATGNVVVQLGATPVLVDIDPQTFCLDPASLDDHITSRTRAIVPVHAFGLCADMASIRDTADSRSVFVLEDAACALGSTYHGASAGSLGDAACFSFHPRKIITTGEGGMITTDQEDLFDRMRLLASHGAMRGANYQSFHLAGYNYRLSDLQAAIGVVQMSRLEGILATRRRLASIYNQLLCGIAEVTPPVEPAGYTHSYQSYVVMLDDAIMRDTVIERMRDDGIETTLGTYSLHSQPFYRKTYDYTEGQLPKSRRAFNQSLTLPLHPGMANSDLEYVVEHLAKHINALT